MIKIEGINKKFGKFEVLKNINLNLSGNNIIALIGANASGKTTLIKTVLGMVIPDSGKILVNGTEISNQWQYRKLIGYMPQIGRYPENMRVAQVLEMVTDLRGNENKNLDHDLYEGFKLKDILDKKMGTLSGGTRQKVSAHLAFLFNSPILILDEPTAGLDPLSSFMLKEKIQAERDKGKLVLITSHILSELDDIVNQIIYMEEGEVIFDKSIHQLMEDTQKSKLSEAIPYLMKLKLEKA